MTQLKILNYAYLAALNCWAVEHDRLKENPNNTITQAREQKLWAEVEEIRDMAIAEEARESQTL